MKLLGKCVLALLVLVLLSSITLWVLAKNIKPDTMKQLVCDQITSLTHKKSQINGDISWQLLPRPGLRFTKIQIGDAQVKENYSITVNTMLLNLQITPLLKGKFVFNEINADGLKLQINNDDLSPLPTSIATPENKNNHVLLTQQFAIQKFVLTHSELVINKNGHNTVFKNIQATIEHFNLQNAPFPIQIKAKLTESALFGTAKANINFQGRLSLASTILNELQNGLSSSTLEGQLSIQNILLNKFAIKKINATIKTRKGGIMFNPLTLSLYDGESIGDMEYKIANQQIALNQSATKLNGKQFLSGLSDHELLSGLLDYSVHATLPLDKISLNTISGTGTITIKDGELYHINLNQLISKLKDKLDGLAAAPKKLLQPTDWNSNQPIEGSTPFKLASIQYKLHDGYLISDSTLLQTEQLQVNSEGSLNLATQDLKANLKIILNNNTDNSLQKIQQDLGGYVPFEISGTLEKPIAVPDFKLLNIYLDKLLSTIPLEQPIKQIRKTLKNLVD